MTLHGWSKAVVLSLTSPMSQSSSAGPVHKLDPVHISMQNWSTGATWCTGQIHLQTDSMSQIMLAQFGTWGHVN